MESEVKFKKAKGLLAQSQGLLDKVRGSQKGTQMTPQEPSGEALPPEPVNIPSAPQTPPQSDPEAIKGAVKEAMEPYMKEIEALIKEKNEKPHEAVLKVEGTLEPKAQEGAE